jgi:hypothetical protein
MTNGRRRFAKTVAAGAIAALAADVVSPPGRADLQKMMASALKEAYEEEIGQNFRTLLSRKVDTPAISRFVSACELVTRTYLNCWKRLTQINVPSG